MLEGNCESVCLLHSLSKSNVWSVSLSLLSARSAPQTLANPYRRGSREEQQQHAPSQPPPSLLPIQVEPKPSRTVRFVFSFTFFFRFRFLNISNSFRGELYRRCLGFSKMLLLNVKILRRKLLAVLVHESTVNIELFVFRFFFLVTDFFFSFLEKFNRFVHWLKT